MPRNCHVPLHGSFVVACLPCKTTMSSTSTTTSKLFLLSRGRKIFIPSLWNLSTNASRNGISGSVHDNDGLVSMLKEANVNAITLAMAGIMTKLSLEVWTHVTEASPTRRRSRSHLSPYEAWLKTNILSPDSPCAARQSSSSCYISTKYAFENFLRVRACAIHQKTAFWMPISEI